MATLQDYLGITKLRDAWPKWKANLVAVNNQVIAHVAGTADKHAAENITYSGDFAGKTEIKAALDQAKSEIDTIVISASIDPEVAFARDSAVKSKVFGSLDARLEEDEQDLVTYKAETTQYLNPTGGADDTSYLQGKLNAFPHITLRPGIYYIDAVTMLIPPANRTIVFMEGAILQCITNISDSYKIISINSDNIEIINPQIIGDRTTHTGITGGWGHGIAIGTCDNIRVVNPIVKNCWGDGINILSRSGKITIDNPVCDNNRRQGISIISADDLTINSPTCSNTNGTAPSAGIDIEPTFAEDVFNSVKINNPYTYNNVGPGITINLSMIKATNKTVSINIVNHVDKLSIVGFIFSNNQSGVNGKIVNQSPFYEKSQVGSIYIRSCEAIGTPTIEINSPTVLNPNESNSPASTASNGIFIHRPLGDAGVNPIGNVVITNPRVIDNRAISQTARGIYQRDEKDVPTQKIYIIDPFEISGILTNINKVSFNPGGVIFRDRFESFILDNVGNTTVSDPYSKVINNANATKTIFTLNLILIQDFLMKFVNGMPAGLQIKPEATTKLFPISSIAGKYIETTQIGASLTLRKINSTDYYIDSMTGTWTVEP